MWFYVSRTERVEVVCIQDNQIVPIPNRLQERENVYDMGSDMRVVWTQPIHRMSSFAKRLSEVVDLLLTSEGAHVNVAKPLTLKQLHELDTQRQQEIEDEGEKVTRKFKCTGRVYVPPHARKQEQANVASKNMSHKTPWRKNDLDEYQMIKEEQKSARNSKRLLAYPLPHMAAHCHHIELLQKIFALPSAKRAKYKPSIRGETPLEALSRRLPMLCIDAFHGMTKGDRKHNMFHYPSYTYDKLPNPQWDCVGDPRQVCSNCRFVGKKNNARLARYECLGHPELSHHPSNISQAEAMGESSCHCRWSCAAEFEGTSVGKAMDLLGKLDAKFKQNTAKVQNKSEKAANRSNRFKISRSGYIPPHARK